MTYNGMNYKFGEKKPQSQEVKVVIEVKAPKAEEVAKAAAPAAPAAPAEPAVFRTGANRADLAVAYPLSDDVIGFTLTVTGKPLQFTMKRSAAASFIGRMAEVLAK